VLSPIAAEGTDLRHGQEVLIAASSDDWVEQIGELLHDDDLWQRISNAALAHAQRHYSRRQGLIQMGQALQQLGLPVREIAP